MERRPEQPKPNMYTELDRLMDRCQQPGEVIRGISQTDLSLMAVDDTVYLHLLSSGDLQLKLQKKDGMGINMYTIDPHGLVGRFEQYYMTDKKLPVVETIEFQYDKNRLAERKWMQQVEGHPQMIVMHEGYQYFESRPNNQYTERLYFYDRKGVDGQYTQEYSKTVTRTYEERQLAELLNGVFRSTRPGKPVQPVDIFSIANLAEQIGLDTHIEKIDDMLSFQLPEDWEAYGDMYRGKIVLNSDGRVVEQWKPTFPHVLRHTYTYDRKGRLTSETVYEKKQNQIVPKQELYYYTAEDDRFSRQFDSQYSGPSVN